MKNKIARDSSVGKSSSHDQNLSPDQFYTPHLPFSSSIYTSNE